MDRRTFIIASTAGLATTALPPITVAAEVRPELYGFVDGPSSFAPTEELIEYLSWLNRFRPGDLRDSEVRNTLAILDWNA